MEYLNIEDVKIFHLPNTLGLLRNLCTGGSEVIFSCINYTNNANSNFPSHNLILSYRKIFLLSKFYGNAPVRYPLKSFQNKLKHLFINLKRSFLFPRSLGETVISFILFNFSLALIFHTRSEPQQQNVWGRGGGRGYQVDNGAPW